MVNDKHICMTLTARTDDGIKNPQSINYRDIKYKQLNNKIFRLIFSDLESISQNYRVIKIYPKSSFKDSQKISS